MHCTRNAAYLRVPGVRIPPSPHNYFLFAVSYCLCYISREHKNTIIEICAIFVPNRDTLMRIFSRKSKTNSRIRTWYVDYYDPQKGSRVRKACGATKKEAEAMRREIEADLYRPTGSAKVETDNPPFNEYMQDYIDHLGATGITNSSLNRYTRIIQNLVDYVWEHKPGIRRLSDLRTKDVWDYIHQRKSDGIQDKTISNELMEIKKCFRFALEINALDSNPVQNIKFKPAQKTLPHFFTQPEIKKIFGSFSKDWMKDIFRVFLFTGLRKGELMHLQWSDIDFAKRLIHVRHQIIKDGIIIYKTKTTSSARTIPMYDEVYDVLRRQRDRKFDKNYVFVNSAKVPFRDDDLYHYLKPRLVKLGIQGSLHTFRHTFASLLIEAGVGLRELKELLGHSRIETTMQYAHLYPHRLHDQVNQLKNLEIETGLK